MSTFSSSHSFKLEYVLIFTVYELDRISVLTILTSDATSAPAYLVAMQLISFPSKPERGTLTILIKRNDWEGLTTLKTGRQEQVADWKATG